MSDIFISYAKEDRGKAKDIAEALKQQGLSVWWDRSIPPGKTFDAVIEDALDAANCVIVLWSKTSVSSKWVKIEASEGNRRGILIPVLIDDVKIPLAFRRIQAADLRDWEGKLPHPEFNNLLNAIAEILGRPVQPSQKTNEVRDVAPEKVNISIKKDQRSWYRNPTYLTIIAFIAAAIISLVWVSTISAPPADFSIAISPIQGAVHQGGVITTAITIKGIQEYEHPVALSTNVQPSGIAVSFVPPIGEPTPSYTSTVRINVDSSVLKDNYKIVMTGTGADGKEHSCSYTLTVKPSVTPSPPVMPTPSPTPTITPHTSAATPTPSPTPYIIDTMDSTSGWETYIENGTESSINIKSIPGRTDNAIAISYDLKEGGYVAIYKEINPEILSGIEGIRFFYKGSGRPNTLALVLVYNDLNWTSFGVSWDRATVKDDWVSIEVPYTNFDCWWPEDNCLHYGYKLDLENVRTISFAISNNITMGDVYGSGEVIIDDVQEITS
jgi:hypothetical protein